MLSNDKVISNILVELFQRLDANGIRYCVLRDYDGLPETFRSDIDFLVDPSDRLQFQDLLLKVSEAHGWRLAKHIRKYALWFYYLFPCQHDGGGRFIFHVDLFYDIAWKGNSYLSSQDILQDRGKFRQFYIPSPWHEAAILLMKDLLHTGYARQKYQTRIRELINQNPVELQVCFQRAFGKNLTQAILDYACNGQWHEIEAHRRSLQVALARRSWMRSPLAQPAKWLLFVLGHTRQYLDASQGLFIVLLGSDGAGKTTVFYEVVPLIEKLFRRVRRLSFNFGTVPHILGNLRDWRQAASQKIAENDVQQHPTGPRLEPFSAFRATAHLIYHTLGYLTGYLYLFYSRRMGDLVIMERYIYDYMIQPRYQHIPKWMLKVVQAIVPKPDAVIHLHGDPQLIYNRKPELPAKEIHRQGRVFQDLLLRRSNGYEFDVSESPQRIARKVAFIICQFLCQRGQGRNSGLR